jgi:F420-0:gamma-glutamyl ligase-like protein
MAWGLVGFVVERLATAERIRTPPTVAAAGEIDVLLRFLR